jgi:hypothetical protein
MERPVRRIAAAAAAIFTFFLFGGTESSPGSDVGGGGDGAHVDLVVRKVTVTPARAHVGDTIRIEMVWQYWGDMISNYYDTTVAEVLANGKLVAGKPFVYNFGAQLGDEYRETFLWDTKGIAPGTYRIRGQVPLQLDSTPYDNFLVVKEPVILAPQGAPFPSGEESGGTVSGKNPFWIER